MHPWPNDGSRYAELRNRKHKSFSMETTALWLYTLLLLHSPVRDTDCTQALWFTTKKCAETGLGKQCIGSRAHKAGWVPLTGAHSGLPEGSVP